MREGRKPTDAAGTKAPERREPTMAEFEFGASPRTLREALAAVDAVLAGCDPEIKRRVRLLLGEIIGRSCNPGRDRSGTIRITLAILPSSVRVDLAGMALLVPEERGDPERDPASSFPAWVLTDLADQWGRDRRTGQPAMWFLVAQALPR